MRYIENIPKVNTSKPLVFILFSIILGNIGYLIYSESILGAILLIVPFIFILMLIKESKFKVILVVFLLFSFISCGFYYGMRENKRGIYTVRVDKITKSEVEGELRGRKVIIYGDIGDIETGGLIKFKGKFKKNIIVEDGIVGSVFIKENLGEKNGYAYYINRLSEKYFERLSTIMGEKSSGLLAALVFGNKDFLSYDQKSNLVDLGVIHLICISGLHLTLLFSYISKIFNIKITLVLCCIYVLAIGMPPSAVRALVMIITLAMTKKVFKTYDAISALSLSAIFLLFYKPYNLYDIGFALSYLATLGIILFNSKLNKSFYKLPTSFNKYLSVTLAAQSFIYPYMVLRLNSFPVNFLISGALVTPIISLILPLAFLTIFFIWSTKIIIIISLPIKLLIMSINGIIIALDNIIIPNVYISNLYAVGYLIMMFSFYMSYKGLKNFRYIFYMVVPTIMVCSFSFSMKIKYLEDGYNKALIIEKGFNKIAITEGVNEYWYSTLRKKHGVIDIYNLTDELMLKIGDEAFLSVDPELNNPYLICKEYDIINLMKYRNSYIKVSSNGVTEARH